MGVELCRAVVEQLESVSQKKIAEQSRMIRNLLIEAAIVQLESVIELAIRAAIALLSHGRMCELTAVSWGVKFGLTWYTPEEAEEREAQVKADGVELAVLKGRCRWTREKVLLAILDVIMARKG